MSVDALVAALARTCPRMAASCAVRYQPAGQVRARAWDREKSSQRLSRLLPPEPRRLPDGRDHQCGVRTRPRSSNASPSRARSLYARRRSVSAIPPGVYSLSHVAARSRSVDGLYGLVPDPGEDFGIRLGALTVRGERGVLINEPGGTHAPAVEPVLPLPGRAHRRRHRQPRHAGALTEQVSAEFARWA